MVDEPEISDWIAARREIAPWVKAMTEKAFGPAPFAVGDTVMHPTGRRVRIISGTYWAAGGLSNHWSWREILPDDSLSSVIEMGYGWSTKPCLVEGSSQ